MGPLIGTDRIADRPHPAPDEATHHATARSPLALVAAYDTLRLSIYRAKGRPDLPIRIERLGRTTLLRFDDVSYFNTVYSLAPDVSNHLHLIEQWFAGSPYGCRLQTLELELPGALATSCTSRGWTPESTYAWLSGDVTRTSVRRSGGLTIRRPRGDEVHSFLETYLRAFDASPERFPAAIENMRHLFAEPSLHFLLALDGAVPVGVGMLFHIGEHALFCAGAMVPSHRRNGGHEALLAARFELARSLGCTTVHSWAFAGSQSHRNLTRAGLETVAVTQAWHWRAGS